MQIAFWSNYHGQAGVTSNTIATAIYIAMNYELKVLLTHTQYTMSNMESAFENGINDSIIFDDIGIDAIQRLSKSRKLNSNEFDSYTKTLIDNRLDILIGSSKSKKEIFEDNISNNISDILHYATKQYDLVMVDVNSGIKDQITAKVLEQSDIIIINLSQNEKVIGDYFNMVENKALTDKKKIIVLGRYDFNSKCSCKYVKKTYKCKEDIYCVPYSSEFMDSNNNHNVLKFFLSNRKVKSNSDNYSFFKQIEMLSNNILENINVDAERLQKQIEQQGVLGQVKSLFNL